MIKNARKLPQELYKSLTWDEARNAWPQAIHMATDIQIYFCDPQALGNAAATRTQWIAPQYIPRALILRYSQLQLNAIARQ